MVTEDELPARDKLSTLLRDLPDVEVVATCAHGTDAVRQIREQRPALLFLDVKMPDMDGFDVIAALAPGERPPAIVFTTAYDSFAVRAFGVNATDYLLKPFTRDRLIEAVRRARERLEQPEHVRSERIETLIATLGAQSAASQRLPVRTNEGVEFVKTADIDWLQADGNYCRLTVGPNEMRMRGTLSNFEERLATAGFIRVHRSYLVNRESIIRAEPWANGEYILIMRGGRKLNTGRGYGERVRELVGTL
jgi:two-component system, LytTR family, response regulator